MLNNTVEFALLGNSLNLAYLHALHFKTSQLVNLVAIDTLKVPYSTSNNRYLLVLHDISLNGLMPSVYLIKQQTVLIQHWLGFSAHTGHHKFFIQTNVVILKVPCSLRSSRHMVSISPAPPHITLMVTAWWNALIGWYYNYSGLMLLCKVTGKPTYLRFYMPDCQAIFIAWLDSSWSLGWFDL